MKSYKITPAEAGNYHTAEIFKESPSIKVKDLLKLPRKSPPGIKQPWLFAALELSTGRELVICRDTFRMPSAKKSLEEKFPDIYEWPVSREHLTLLEVEEISEFNARNFFEAS